MTRHLNQVESGNSRSRHHGSILWGKTRLSIFMFTREEHFQMIKVYGGIVCEYLQIFQKLTRWFSRSLKCPKTRGKCPMSSIQCFQRRVRPLQALLSWEHMIRRWTVWSVAGFISFALLRLPLTLLSFSSSTCSSSLSSSFFSCPTPFFPSSFIPNEWLWRYNGWTEVSYLLLHIHCLPA